MNTMQSWRDSIKLLYFQNLKPVLMVTAKTVLDVYPRINLDHPLTIRGNWMLAVGLVVLIILTNIINFLHLIWLPGLMLNTVLHTMYFFACLTIRPSVAIKDKAYYRSYVMQYWYLLLLGVVLGNTYFFVIPFAFILYIFFVLFAFDGGGSFKATL